MKFLTLTVLAAALSASVPSRAGEPLGAQNPIYYGDSEGVSPGTVRSSDCYNAISEWMEIKRRGLTDKDPDYYILLRKASERFYRAVEDVARAKGHDLVAEQGTLQVEDGKPAPPDLTQAVIAEIKNDKDGDK